MQYKATAKYIRSSTRKVRLVADAIRRLPPLVALDQLKHMSREAAVPLSKVIASALSNARAKQANEETLSFQTIDVLEGPVMKRWHAVSRGQAHPYKKRMTHIRIVLTDDQEGKEDTKDIKEKEGK